MRNSIETRVKALTPNGFGSEPSWVTKIKHHAVPLTIHPTVGLSWNWDNPAPCKVSLPGLYSTEYIKIQHNQSLEFDGFRVVRVLSSCLVHDSHYKLHIQINASDFVRGGWWGGGGGEDFIPCIFTPAYLFHLIITNCTSYVYMLSKPDHDRVSELGWVDQYD